MTVSREVRTAPSWTERRREGVGRARERQRRKGGMKDGVPRWIHEYEKDAWAAEWENGAHLAVASWLEGCIEHGVDPTVPLDGKTALELAVQNTWADREDIEEVVIVLLKHGGGARLTEANWVELIEAAGARMQRGEARTLVKLLVAHGGNGRGVGAYVRKSAIARAIVNADHSYEARENEDCRDWAEVVQWLCEGSGIRQLEEEESTRGMAKVCAVATRVRSGLLRHTMVKMLIDAKADVTESDRTRRGPLFEAAVRNDGATVRLILENGGDVNELLVSRGHMQTGLMWDPALGTEMGGIAHDPLSALGCAATLEDAKLELLKKGKVRIEGYHPSVEDNAVLAPGILLKRRMIGWPAQTGGPLVEEKAGKKRYYAKSND